MLHSLQECKERGERPGLSPGSQRKEGEEADSESHGGQEQIQEEKWMVCLVHGVISLSHSRNNQIIIAHCLKQTYFNKDKNLKDHLELSFSCTNSCL